MSAPRPLKVGIGGPVGSGKTALVESLVVRLRDRYDVAVITNDIYTQEDAQFLIRRGALPEERVVGVETGGCPHTAIREDASVNLEAVHQLTRRFPDRSGKKTLTLREACDREQPVKPDAVIRFLEDKLGIEWIDPELEQNGVERPKRAYSPAGSYAVGDAIEHPKYGLGTVLTALAGKMTVRFADGDRVLVTAR